MLELVGIGRRYRVDGGEVRALADIDLVLPKGSFTALVGRSGCGKTTLLRILAGLESPSEGEIRRPAQAGPLRIGVVFQEARLMPWLDVRGNVGFGLHGRLPRHETAARCTAALDLVGLSAFAGAMPGQLSGGMAQRVAIARALVLEPEVLLLDEPFAALDAFTRRAMQNELVGIWQRRKPTVVFVTHDVEEAVLLGERVLEMQAGRIVGRENIELPYPRDPTAPEANRYRRTILARLMADPAAARPEPAALS
ncbi:ABC transporter ATP-binding protein [Bosea sp. TND4EK4]|uniref:ABC transporter ATP-binding protein n=1 Tax=Bosea sp. TND4EK4 TaxID=1907408 RepID=UPI000956388F|nr:ABC transporter ATP-binding protein [Bosea sp. TND4EK4]SIQ21246.1 sulfonate transport system ATP-binding protein [Bosea sp. TND4EK4]